jgi:hypothetical protein
MHTNTPSSEINSTKRFVLFSIIHDKYHNNLYFNEPTYMKPLLL